MEAIPPLKLTQVILGHAMLIADANWERSYAQDSPMHCKHPNLKKKYQIQNMFRQRHKFHQIAEETEQHPQRYSNNCRHREIT